MNVQQMRPGVERPVQPMQKTALALLIAVLALGAAPSARALASPASESGVTGTVLMSPVCPVAHNPPLPQCAPRPYQATITVKTADGKEEVTHFTSDSDGRFKITLEPGKYLLVPVNGKPYPRGAPQTVSVRAGKFTAVTVMYDTGMR